ncbi:MAG: TIGR03936 family radical SAM-associated protein [Clostridia bacterium]|nr:TIGR03936 family radical SAM-associated protein [Clostridia bacterium]
MILFRYKKDDGAEYISHLDMLKNLCRTFRRMGIKIGYSQGFHPHMHVYMSAPLGVGIKSYSEYCLVDTNESEESFLEKFNKYSRKGITCLYVRKTDKKVGIASDIVKAEYLLKGNFDFEIDEITESGEFLIKDKNGNDKNVRELIYGVERTSEGLRCVLGFSNGLRIEKFIEKITADHTGKVQVEEIIKLNGVTEDGHTIEESVE